jgi:hypothetical protein
MTACGTWWRGWPDRWDCWPSFDSTARGDHVEVRQSTTGLPGAGLTLTASATQHVGAELTLSAGAVFPNFLESDQFAREQMDISGTPTVGDTVRTVITLAGGTKVTNTVTAVVGSTPGTLLNALAAARSMRSQPCKLRMAAP